MAAKTLAPRAAMMERSGRIAKEMRPRFLAASYISTDCTGSKCLPCARVGKILIEAYRNVG